MSLDDLTVLVSIENLPPSAVGSTNNRSIILTFETFHSNIKLMVWSLGRTEDANDMSTGLDGVGKATTM